MSCLLPTHVTCLTCIKPADARMGKQSQMELCTCIRAGVYHWCPLDVLLLMFITFTFIFMCHNMWESLIAKIGACPFQKFCMSRKFGKGMLHQFAIICVIYSNPHNWQKKERKKLFMMRRRLRVRICSC